MGDNEITLRECEKCRIDIDKQLLRQEQRQDTSETELIDMKLAIQELKAISGRLEKRNWFDRVLLSAILVLLCLYGVLILELEKTGQLIGQIVK